MDAAPTSSKSVHKGMQPSRPTKTNDWHVTVTPIKHPCGDALWWKATVIAPWGATICEATRHDRAKAKAFADNFMKTMIYEPYK